MKIYAKILTLEITSKFDKNSTSSFKTLQVLDDSTYVVRHNDRSHLLNEDGEVFIGGSSASRFYGIINSVSDDAEGLIRLVIKPLCEDPYYYPYKKTPAWYALRQEACEDSPLGQVGELALRCAVDSSADVRMIDLDEIYKVEGSKGVANSIKEYGVLT